MWWHPEQHSTDRVSSFTFSLSSWNEFIAVVVIVL